VARLVTPRPKRLKQVGTAGNDCVWEFAAGEKRKLWSTEQLRGVGQGRNLREKDTKTTEKGRWKRKESGNE